MSQIEKITIGIDISDYSIEAVAMGRSGGIAFCLGVSRTTLADQTVDRGVIKNMSALSAALLNALEGLKSIPATRREYVFTLPENLVYLHIFDADEAFFNDKAKRIESEVRRVIPLKYEDLHVSYRETKPAPGADKKTLIALTAVEKKNLEIWKNFLLSAGINAELFDIGTLALRRALIEENSNEPILVADIGARMTKISIFFGKNIVFSYFFDQGVNQLVDRMTENIKKSDGNLLTRIEAETAFTDSGLSGPDTYPGIGDIIKAGLNPMIEEIKKARVFYKEKTGRSANKIFLAGGGANIKGIADHFKEALKKDSSDDIAVSLPAPLYAISGNPLFYLEAMGAALAGLERKWDDCDPFIRSEYQGFKKIEFNLIDWQGVKEKIIYIKDEAMYRLGMFRGAAIWIAAMVFFIALFAAALLNGNQPHKKTVTADPASSATYDRKYAVKAAINTNPDALKPGEISGRLIDEPVMKTDSYEKAMEVSRQAALASLKAGEVLWGEAIMKPVKKASLAFPLDFTWLAFTKTDADTAGSLYIQEQTNGQLIFSPKSVSWDRLERSPSDAASFVLYGREEIITKDAQAPASTTR